jgi:hypothetical protein
MTSPPETRIPASTVDKNSAESPSDTGCVFDDESDQSAGTEGDCLPNFNFESLDGNPVQEYKWTHHECVLQETVGADEKIWPRETAAGEVLVRGNRSECGGEEEVKTESPSAVWKLSSSCVTHNARTNTRSSKSRPVQGRIEQSGVTRRKVQARHTTRAFTRSQGPVPSEEDGASTMGGTTAVGIKDDVGQMFIKKEKL